MEKLLVLGQVPGTDIEITFAMWLNATAVLVALALLFYYTFLRRSTKSTQASLVPTTIAVAQRNPLHATRLHR